MSTAWFSVESTAAESGLSEFKKFCAKAMRYTNSTLQSNLNRDFVEIFIRIFFLYLSKRTAWGRFFKIRQEITDEFDV